MRRPPPLIDEGSLAIVPANEASWDDLATIFGARGYTAHCQCQRYKIGPHGWTDVPVFERAARLRVETRCGDPAATTTTGLVAYLDGDPVGWCAVEPRTAYARLRRMPVPWTGRHEDKDDAGVWAVTCFATRAGYRRRGVSRALARATVDFARTRGRPSSRGLPDGHRAGPGCRLGRTPRRQLRHLRRRRVHGGQPPDAQEVRHAH